MARFVSLLKGIVCGHHHRAVGTERDGIDAVWEIPLGELAELTAKGVPSTGTEKFGGPLVTAGGRVFIGATKDGMFRAFDRRSGKIIWESELPAAAFATPSTYEVGGRQYIVMACGGGKLGSTRGDSYVAFALS